MLLSGGGGRLWNEGRDCFFFFFKSESFRPSLLTERYFLVHDAVSAGRGCGYGERDTVQNEAPRNTWPGHFAGSDDTHQLERRRRRAARVIRYGRRRRRRRKRSLCAQLAERSPHVVRLSGGGGRCCAQSRHRHDHHPDHRRHYRAPPRVVRRRIKRRRVVVDVANVQRRSVASCSGFFFF